MKIQRDSNQTDQKQIKQSGEDKEFEDYVKKEGWQEDGDKYGIEGYFGAYMSPGKMLYDSEYQAHYNMCLKQYIAKKYCGINMTEFREKLARKLDIKDNNTHNYIEEKIYRNTQAINIPLNIGIPFLYFSIKSHSVIQWGTSGKI